MIANTIDRLAHDLRARETQRAPRAPLRHEYPDLSVADAYAVQDAFVALRRKQTGSRLVGRKIGATNPVIQKLLGVDQPDYGQLLDDMVLPDGAAIPLQSLIQPRVEVEIAFILGRDLVGPGVTTTQVMLATEAVVASFEIIDSRIVEWDIKFIDTVADNGSSALAVLSDRLLRPTKVDMRTIGVVLENGGRVVDTGAGAASLGHPARAIAWLANALAQFEVGLEAGQILLSGSLTTAPLVQRPTRFTAHFSTLGAVSCEFEEGETT